MSHYQHVFFPTLCPCSSPSAVSRTQHGHPGSCCRTALPTHAPLQKMTQQRSAGRMALSNSILPAPCCPTCLFGACLLLSGALPACVSHIPPCPPLIFCTILAPCLQTFRTLSLPNPVLAVSLQRYLSAKVILKHSAFSFTTLV